MIINLDLPFSTCLYWLTMWIVANSAPMWYFIYKNKRIKPNKERDLEKFKPFVRLDYDEWSYFMTIFTHFFFWPRFFACWVIIIVGISTMFVVLIGQKREQPMNPVRLFITS